MVVTPPPIDIDPVLAPFVAAADEDAARDALGEALARHASPLIRRIAGRQLGSITGASDAEADLEDVHAAVLLRLTAQCWLLRRDEAAPAIASLSSYVATTTYNTCHEWLRARAPRRTRLQSRVRYVLTRDTALALWEVADRDWWCGVRTSQSAGVRRTSEDVQRAVERQMATVSRQAETPGSPRVIVSLVRGTLTALDAPCRLNDLVSALAAVLGEVDVGLSVRARRGRHDDGSDEGDLAERIEDRSASPAEALEHRDDLTRLWAEIVLLPPRQRVALLLNLRDEQGGGMLALFPVTGVASTADIAKALELPDASLSELWPTLPHDDQWIAEYLGITRRQVINLRKCARERLARRMRAQETTIASGSR
jgi:RNA polymerase sigma factor (sigma-70 family)